MVLFAPGVILITPSNRRLMFGTCLHNTLRPKMIAVIVGESQVSLSGVILFTQLEIPASGAHRRASGDSKNPRVYNSIARFPAINAS